MGMKAHTPAAPSAVHFVSISCCRPLAWLLIFCSIFAIGCAAGALPEDDGAATTVFEGPVARDCVLQDAPSWLAFDGDGAIVRFDGQTGAIDAWAEPLADDGGEGLRDLAVDCRGERVVVYRELGDQGGELGERRLDADGFGPWHGRASVDGWMRSTPLEQGVLSFEVGYGERWRVLRDDGRPSASVPLPVPRSLWLSPDGGSLDALVLRGTAPTWLSWVRASLGPDGFEVLSEAPLAWGEPAALATMRSTRRHDGMLVARSHDGELQLHQLHPERDPELLLSVPVGAGTVEEIVAHEPHAYEDRFWILLREPSELVAVSLQTRAAVSVSLEGRVAGEQPFFSRALVVRGRRAWVATEAGVLAFDWVGGEEPEVVADAHFEGAALHGPLAGPVAAGAR